MSHALRSLVSVPALQLLMVPDHLVDDEAQEFLAEFGIEVRLLGQPAQPGDLGVFAAGIGGREAGCRLVATDRLGHLETFREQEDEGGIDIVDALAVAAERFVGHFASPSI